MKFTVRGVSNFAAICVFATTSLASSASVLCVAANGSLSLRTACGRGETQLEVETSGIATQEQLTSLQAQVTRLATEVRAKSPVPLARAYSRGNENIDNSSGRNKHISVKAFDFGDTLKMEAGPVFTAPISGIYVVNYHQMLLNSTQAIYVPEAWHYSIGLRINQVDDYTYGAGISNIGHTSDYCDVIISDVLHLSVGDTLEPMERVDFEGPGYLQKGAGVFSVYLVTSDAR